MGVRVIAGRAGSGKTHGCLARITEELARGLIDGPKLVLLVPEQAALQVERALLTMSGARTLGRCEVLSFRRLAFRILNEISGPTPVPLTATGRQMALRYLIGRHRRSLLEFGKVAERGGFLAALSASIAELLQESVTLEQLDAAAARAQEEQHPSAPRLNDVALLYKAYLDYLGSRRVDPEGVLDLARDRLGSADWLTGAKVWIDGFAGFTQQQLRMIVALAQSAEHVDIALLMEPTPDAQGPPDPLSLFARTEQTWGMAAKALREAGVSIEPPLLLRPSAPPRFSRAPMLADLERRLFAGATCGTGFQPVSAAARDDASAATTPLSSVRLTTAPDRRTEVSTAVRAIVDLVQSPAAPLRYRDIAVIVRDLEPYHDLLSAALTAQGIPFFIDRRRPTFHHPLVQLVRAAISLHGAAPFDQALAAIFKTGLSGLSDAEADALENYALAHGLASPEAWDEPWKFPPPGYDEHDDPSPAMQRQLAWLNESREKIRGLLGEWRLTDAARKGRPACRKWVERLCALLMRLGISQRLQGWCAQAAARGDLDEASEHEQVWADLMKLLEELLAALGDEPMTIRQFRDCLESGLSQLTLGLVPATLDQVLVSSIERSRHPPVRAVFVLGFGEGQFPARHFEDAMFGDEDRQRLEAVGAKLSRTRVSQLLDERMLAYIAFTRASDALWVSYPLSDERGRPLTASPYWPDLLAALPGVQVEQAVATGPAAVSTPHDLAAGLAAWIQDLSRREDAALAPGDPANDANWKALYEWARTRDSVAGRGRPPGMEAVGTPTLPVRCSVRDVLQSTLSALAPVGGARLAPTTAAALWRAPYRTSVTALEDFAWCPFKHFAQRGLRLRERARHEIAAVDLGRLYHGVLQQFVNEMIERDATLGEMPVDEISKNLDRLCQLAVPKYAESVRMLESERRKALWRGRHELPPALRGHQRSIGRTKLRPLMTEMPFGLEEAGALPALTLDLGDGRIVLVRGKIDRIDVTPAEDGAIGIVFDYKRGLGRTLRLHEVYHGLALQLLAYLLVLREYGKTDSGAKIIPGGAFYLPLLGALEKVDAPGDDSLAESLKPFKPRGVIDFDALARIEGAPPSGRSESFNVHTKTDGGMGNVETTDGVAGSDLPLILNHVHEKMTDLARRWLDGEIAVSPARVGKRLPCAQCLFRGVCRFEYSSKETRVQSLLGRSEVLNLLTTEAAKHG